MYRGAAESGNGLTALARAVLLGLCTCAPAAADNCPSASASTFMSDVSCRPDQPPQDLPLQAPVTQAADAAGAASETKAADAPVRAAQRRRAARLLHSMNTAALDRSPPDVPQLGRLWASPMVHDLDPQNPAWSPMHPKWNSMLELLASDIQADIKAHTDAWRSQLEGVMIEEFAQRIGEADLTQLSVYFDSGAGKRYLGFQQQVDPLISAVMRAVFQHEPLPPGAPPAQQVLKERLRVLSLSTIAQVTQGWVEEAQRTHGDMSGFQALGFIAAAVAVRQGDALDAIGRRYAADLPAFESFTKSALGRRFYAAFGAASLALAPAQTSITQTFQNSEEGKFGARWKSAYADEVAKPERAAVAAQGSSDQ